MSVIFFDIDGTIMDSNGQIPQSTKKAMQLLHQAGHACVINTGRPFSDIDEPIKDLAFDGYICSCGQYILLHGKELLNDSFDPATCKLIMDTAKDCGGNLYLEANSGAYLEKWFPDISSPEIDRAIDRFEKRGFHVGSSAGIPDFHFDKLCFVYSTHSQTERFLAFISHYCEIIDRGMSFYELPKRGNSKATGISVISESLNISPKDCFAVGDSANDLAMLQFVGHPIVMGNAPEDVKQYAEYVTADFSEDGLYRAMAHFGLFGTI